MAKDRVRIFCGNTVGQAGKGVSIFKIAIFLVVTAVVLVGGISGYVSWTLTHPPRQAVVDTPRRVGIDYQDVSFTSRVDNLTLKGWLIAAPGNRQTVIFAHGYGKNRLQDDVPLLPIVQALVNRGINVLMFDFRNSGESEGKLTSVGQYEVRDLLGAVDFVRSRGELSQKITLYGFSMGAATAILAGAQEPAVAAVVADASFADLPSYLRDNLPVWTHLPAMPFNQAVLFIAPLLTGIDPGEVRPVNCVKYLGGRPLLLIHGEADADIPIADSEWLQQEYPGAELLRLPAARHVQSFGADPQRYLATVVRFLEK